MHKLMVILAVIFVLSMIYVTKHELEISRKCRDMGGIYLRHDGVCMKGERIDVNAKN